MVLMENLTLSMLIFLLVGALLLALFVPRGGLLKRGKDWRRSQQRQQIEDALKYIFNLQLEEQNTTVDALAGALHLSEKAVFKLILQLQTQGLAEQERSFLRLTPEGQRWALQVVRAHRLWERYLADEARVPLNQIHSMAHRLEHKSSATQIDDLDAALGYPIQDPHGDPIPNAAGVLRKFAERPGGAIPLAAWQVGERGQIAHLEDEPPLVYAQLLADGLKIGQDVTVLARSSERIVLTDGQREINIAPAVAANVYLQAAKPSAEKRRNLIPLSALKSRAAATIVQMDERCQGFTRRRFLDLGLTPGTRIFPELENAFREPRAYRVRGTLIALRDEQAAMILVEPESGRMPAAI
jgi:DtxR family Mn-dependent transcriptional regulator